MVPLQSLSKPKVVMVALLVTFFIAGGIYLGVKHRSSPNLLKTSHGTTPLNAASNTTMATQSNQTTQIKVTTTTTPTSTPVEEASSTALDIQSMGSEISQVTDNQYGVKFQYATQMNNGGDKTNVMVKKQGNKITLYPEDSPNTNDYIQVFTKAPGDTLEQAITKTVLQGYNLSDCPIGIAYGSGTASFPSNIETASIRYNTNNQNPNSGYPIEASKCPGDYTAIETPMYFLMDKNHLDRFIFVLDGVALTSGLASGGNTGDWIKTLDLF